MTGENLRHALATHTDPSRTHLQTDSAPAYRKLAAELGFASHESVDHAGLEYVRGDVTTKHAEGYFSQLKRSLDGTHHHVSREHLGRYLSEFDSRYSTRFLSDTDRMRRTIGQAAGRRLMYRHARLVSEDA